MAASKDSLYQVESKDQQLIEVKTIMATIIGIDSTRLLVVGPKLMQKERLVQG